MVGRSRHCTATPTSLTKTDNTSIRNVLVLGAADTRSGDAMTEAQYKATLARVEELFDAEPGTAQGDELETLLLLVEKYEEKWFPIGSTEATEDR